MKQLHVGMAAQRIHNWDCVFVTFYDFCCTRRVLARIL